MDFDCDNKEADIGEEGIGSTVSMNAGLTVVAVEPLACADQRLGRSVVAD